MPANSSDVVHIAVISTFPPRRCGIATYSRDLCATLGQLPGMAVRVAAIDEPGAERSYPHQVVWRVNDQDASGYLRLADELADWAHVVLIQHEYGLFGGAAGDSILQLLEAASIPMVTTLHTVLSRPEPAIRRVTDAICARSAAVIVPGPRSEAVLRMTYRTGPARVVQIPHGISEVSSTPPVGNDQFLLLGFGYLGRNKGVENALAAMPYLIRRYPQLRYRVVGDHHPTEVRLLGDAYPSRLRWLAEQLKVSDRVEFIQRHVSDAELSQMLGEAAICVLPYVDVEQAVSGTLVRALGAGRAVVATGFRHARELADQGAVHLVPMRDPKAIAEAVELLLSDSYYRQRLEDRARTISGEFRWPQVARRYEQVLREIAIPASA